MLSADYQKQFEKNELWYKVTVNICVCWETFSLVKEIN